MRNAVFLDRDGVINRATTINGKSYPPQTLSDFDLLPRVKESVDRLKDYGFIVVVVTNQPDVATGKQQKSVVEAMHGYLRSVLSVDHIEVCYHTENMGCSCRKPKAGMLKSAAASLSIDLTKSYMVGDRWRDVEAGQNAGCLDTFFIDYGYSEKKPQDPYQTVNDLADAVSRILSSQT